MAEKANKIIQEELTEILSLLQIKADIEVIEQKNILVTKISPKKPDDIKILVGWHGQTLSSLQGLLRIILSKKLKDNYQPFMLDVGDYRQKREELLRNIAQGAAEKVKRGGHSIVLDPMNASERRIVHLALVDFTGITTESVGEGKNRRVVIRLSS
jgi:spoIIIJ-associated protein